MKTNLLFEFLKTPLILFFIGIGFWLVQFRVLKIESRKSYVLVYLGSVKTGDQMVFHYPHIESQVYVDTVASNNLGKGYQISTNREVFVKKELVLGRVFYIF